MQVRLQKILSQAGVCSRRKAEALIKLGQVAINGRVARELGTKADPGHDRITVEGKPLPRQREPIYVVLHKPTGVLTTLGDPAGRQTVRDLLPDAGARLYPVGRLDYNSSGLVLLTNDGQLAYRLTHPRFGVAKAYRAKVSGVPTSEEVRRLQAGVELADGFCRPVRVRVEEKRRTKAWLEIVVTEGRQHLVRRLCAAVGHRVEKLARVAVGPVKLGSLKPGRCRSLRPREIALLRRAAGLLPPGRPGATR